MPNIIALVDCDCFFVSCEQADNPNLKNKAVCVISGNGGCVVSRSKEAKKIGVKMGEPYFMAKKEYSGVTYVIGRNARYAEYSAQVMQVLKTFSPDVEICSIDEAYINLNGLDKLYHQNYVELIQNIRQKILELTKIPVSIGLSSSKTLAKLASDKAKITGGTFCINSTDIQNVLKSTNIEDVCGFGRQNTAKMKMNGLYSCWDFVQNSDSRVRQMLGIRGLDLKYELLGHTINKVQTAENHPKSIQDTSALSKFTGEEAVLRASLKYHVHHASHKLRDNDCYCKQVGVLLRTKDFQTFCEYAKLPAPTNGEAEIYTACLKIFAKMYNKNILYRSTGIILEQLLSKEEYQPNLFAVPEYNDDKISRIVDELEKKYGKDIIKNGLF